MLSIKTPLAIIVSAVLAVLGVVLFTTVLSSVSQNYPAYLFSVGVVVYTIVALILSSITNAPVKSGSTSTAPYAKPTAVSGEVSTLYVGNLPYKANEDDVKNHFDTFGKVVSVRLMKDKRTGKRKGFGFVEVDSGHSEKMIASLNDSLFQERSIKVRPAKDKVEG